MTPTHTLRRPPSLRDATGALEVVVPAVAVLLLLLTTSWLSSPPVAPHLAVVNGTEYQLNVSVTGARRGPALDLGTVARERTKPIEQVIDPGREWIFTFSLGGHDVGELAVTRQELARLGWKVSVPPDVADRLRAQGVPPSAFL